MVYGSEVAKVGRRIKVVKVGQRIGISSVVKVGRRIWQVQTLLIPIRRPTFTTLIRRPTFATAIPYTIQYLLQSYNQDICIPLSVEIMQSIDQL